MKDFIRRVPQINFILLIITIFLVRLPPSYILPLKSPLLTSHSLARYLIIGMFVLFLLRLFVLKEKLQFDKKLAILVLFFFATQSLSIINASNLSPFLLDYKNIVFSLALFFITISTIQTQKTQTLVTILLVATLLNVIYETIIYFYPETIYSFFRHLFYDKYWEFFELQFRRQRLFTDTFDEAIVPFILSYIFFQKKRWLKIFALFLLGGVVFFTIFSNWRIKLVMLLFATFATLIILRKSLLRVAHLRPQLSLSTLTLILLLITTLFTRSNAFTRLVSPTKNDLATLAGRLDLWDDAAAIAFYSPLTGVGLGNFNVYLKPAYKPLVFGPQLSLSLSKLTPFYAEIPHIDNPHNIFFSALAETGFLGFLALLLLIAYFIKSDLAVLKASNLRQSCKSTLLRGTENLGVCSSTKNQVHPNFPLVSTGTNPHSRTNWLANVPEKGYLSALPTVAIISFWTLFLFALLNPPTQFAYLFLFWLLRGIIAKQ